MTKEKIRQRKTYQLFARLAEILKENNIEKSLWAINKELNDMRAYGTNTLAMTAGDSLKQLIEDLKEKK